MLGLILELLASSESRLFPTYFVILNRYVATKTKEGERQRSEGGRTGRREGKEQRGEKRET